jgi:hypothetical protein
LDDVPSIKKIVEIAMNGYNNHNAFQTKVKMPIGELLVESASAFDSVMHSPTSDSWGNIRALITEFDNKH